MKGRFSLQSTVLARPHQCFTEVAVAHRRGATRHDNNPGGTAMWTKPSFRDLRLGFEVTLYIANR
ncbi:coenzyme PQQ precursor peptide PqqA [Billgrantia desiderata]|nr:coenzyme PQQ precursor peptide PqqA [Halomonas desiderata]